MRLLKEIDQKSQAEIGKELHDFAAELVPHLQEHHWGWNSANSWGLIHNKIPLQMSEVPTGTPVFDWTVPKEWNIRECLYQGRGREASGRLP